MNFDELREKLSEKLQYTYNLYDNYEHNGLKFSLYGYYNLRSERYIASKKAVIFGMENNDHLFVKKHKEFTRDDLENYLLWVKENVESILFIHKEHMSSTITLICTAEGSLDQELVKQIKKTKFHKGFAFGFKGWVDLRLIVYSLSDNLLITNKKGKEVEELFSKL